MTDMPLNLTTLGHELTQAAGTLQDYCCQLGDELTAAALGQIRRRLGHGLIRIALVGKTSCGKSALVNALLSALIVPENPNTSSPIPVWICRQEEDGVSITVHETRPDENGKPQEFTLPCTLKEFLTKYCYSISDVNDQKRERFVHVDYATVGVRSPLLENGVVLVDTLGIAATTVDSAKTIEVLDDEIDLVLYLTKEPQMKSDEKAFLQKYVLGCHEDAATEYPILPENLLFVYNNFSPREPHNKVAFEASVAEVLAPLNLPQARLDDILSHQLFYINALKGRLARCGAYPYAQYAPDHSTPQEQEALARREARDRQLCERMDPQQLLTESGMEELLSGIVRKAGQYAGGQVIVSKRIGALSQYAHNVRLAANRRLATANLTLSSLEKQKQSMQTFRQDSDVKRRHIKTSMQALEDEYRDSFIRLFSIRQDAIIHSCLGHVHQMLCPDSFIKYADFRAMDNAAKADFLRPYLREIARQTIIAVKKEIKQSLDIQEAHIGAMPFQVLKSARQQISNEMTAFNGRIKKLQEDGLEDTGVHLPEPSAIEELFTAFKVNLDKQIMISIETAMSTGEKAFIDHLEQSVDTVKSNLIFNLFPMLMRREAFWDLILEKAADPMVVELLKKLMELMKDTHTEGIGRATHLAFDATADEINASYIKLSFSLETAIAQLERQLAQTGPMTQELAAQIQQIRQGCDALTQQLLNWQHALSAKG